MSWKHVSYNNDNKCVVFNYHDGATLSLPLATLKQISVHAKPEVVNEFVDDILTCKDKVFIESWGNSIDFEPCSISFSKSHFELWIKASEFFKVVKKIQSTENGKKGGRPKKLELAA